MKVVVRGHVYDLDQIGSSESQRVQFPNKEPGMLAPGSTTQEFCRMLIDRTHYCHNCLPHRVNEQIIWHFRQVIALHEARAIEQKAWKGEFRPELVGLGPDGHFVQAIDRHPYYDDRLGEIALKPIPPLGTQTCDYRSAKD